MDLFNNDEVALLIKEGLNNWIQYYHGYDIGILSKAIRQSELDRNTHVVYPKSNDILKIFNSISLENISVVILGQDPYHDGNATGIAFACRQTISPSLKEIMKSIRRTEKPQLEPVDSSLMHLVNQGVFLLNTTLTVRKGEPNSHKDYGYQSFIEKTIKIISDKRENIVFMLWGKEAKEYEKFIEYGKHLILKDIHPVAASYKNSNWNCNHFEVTNEYLENLNKTKIKWI